MITPARQETPIIGITADVHDGRHRVGAGYATAIAAAGGVPLILPPVVDCVDDYLRCCQGFVFTGGDDPIMERWGVATDPRVTRVDAGRQAFEVALLEALATRPAVPVLGVCLGMQFMGLMAGGTLDQYMPDRHATADDHWGRRNHTVTGPLGSGVVQSHHRQAIAAPGSLRVVATAADGVIEAIDDPARPFYLGVQWHPERTSGGPLGPDLFRRLVDAVPA